MSRSERLLGGKKGLIMGVANERSIAWGIARTAAFHGADLAFTYQNDALAKRVGPLAESAGSSFLLQCDVADPKSLDDVFSALEERWGRLDFVVHAIAFSDKGELKGRYVDTSPENFAMTMNISCYSFTAVCQRALAADAGWREPPHAHLRGRRAGHASLQRHGRGKGCLGGER